jgi:hypothetical protein
MSYERDVLAFNPFEGDRDTTARVLRDSLCASRVADDCMVCLQRIVPGTRIRARVEVYEGRIGTYRFCAACCDAMAASWDDHGRAIEERTALGMRVIDRERNKRRAASAATKGDDRE